MEGWIRGVIAESRSGREMISAKAFVDCTGYGDLAAHAGAHFSEPNDYPVANSIGIGGVNVEGYYQFLTRYGAVTEYVESTRSGGQGRIVRLNGDMRKLPAGVSRRGTCHRHVTHDDDDPR